ncbi:hypothetical protein [Streptomyces sp. TP-A0874]|uniref:hypothetical protein n=1 Tax=Streptomyces sp. TP-A0874 TaxID=549819 RepID=UPI000853BF0D|nr:hypothetical protein [Streptomyces sp. TP-A0874]
MSVDPGDPDAFDQEEQLEELAEFEELEDEAPEADTAEQQTELLPDRDSPMPADPESANPADAAEQARLVALDDEEEQYR